ncbi:MAG: hypothetical protein ABS911_12885 [Carnobacterium sp.]
MENADAVKANGCDFYKVDMGIPEEQMFGLEVQDQGLGNETSVVII